MMLGYIESISSCCVQLALPANLSSSDSVLELVSFRFSTVLSTDQVDQAGFKSKWSRIFAPYLSNATAESELICCCGEWLEADKASEDRFFVSLLFWKPASTPKSQQPQSRGSNSRPSERHNGGGLLLHTPAASSVSQNLYATNIKSSSSLYTVWNESPSFSDACVA